VPPSDAFEIAVLVPCFNEAAAIDKVVRDFRAALPTATVYVYDNNSTDDTAEVARRAGAVVRRERRRGKGNVVRRMFQDIEADAYVMVDGDDTYDAAVAGALVDRLVAERLDMVVGRRIETHQAAYRAGHRLGNRVLTGLVAWLFGAQIDDMLSGYRVFSRRFVKSFPSSSREFEIETELTVHAMQLRMAVAEIETSYKERPPGSTSKLRTFRDGWQILLTITNLVRNERPLLFFSLLGAACVAVAVALGIPILATYRDTGLVPRFPTAILCSALFVIAVVCVATGMILDLVAHVRREARRLVYLQHPAPAPAATAWSASASAAKAAQPAPAATEAVPPAAAPAAARSMLDR
jgi:glycosyltransferase involved in cell wall biosynthesis